MVLLASQMLPQKPTTASKITVARTTIGRNIYMQMWQLPVRKCTELGQNPIILYFVCFGATEKLSFNLTVECFKGDGSTLKGSCEKGNSFDIHYKVGTTSV